MFENRVLRKIYGPMMDEEIVENYITRCALLTKYNLGGTINKNEMDGQVSCKGRDSCILGLMGKPEGKRTLERPMSR